METLTKIIEALGAKLIEAEALLMEIRVLEFNVGRVWMAQFVSMSLCGLLLGTMLGFMIITNVLGGMAH